MNRPSYEEYEEVESPYASNSIDRSSVRNNSKDRLRTRKNVFNRPFATETTSAPLIVETKSTRKTIGRADDTEMLNYRESRLADADIDYLEEEEVEEKRPVVRTSSKKETKKKKNILAKIGWSVVGLLVLRLIFMDRGVMDYFTTENEIQNKQRELKSIQDENKSLRTEISRIQIDKSYQRNLAKEHLGVIAADEFLILFAGENTETTQDSLENNQL